LLLAFSVAGNQVRHSGPITIGPGGVRVGEMVINDDGVRIGEWIVIDDDGITVTEPIEIGEQGIRPVRSPAPPQAVEDPDGVYIQVGGDDRAAYVTGGPSWMENDDRASRVQGIHYLWSQLKSVRRETEATRFTMGRFYRVSDHRALRDMPEDEYDVRYAAGDLGLPLLPIDRNVDDALHDFNLERVDIYDSGDTVSILARSATTTLYFAMVREHGAWKFEVGHVERMQIDPESR